MNETRSLLTLVWRRVLVYAVLAMALQTAVVFANYWFNDEELAQLFVEHETQIIADAYRYAKENGTTFPSLSIVQRYSLEGPDGSRAYLLRIRDQTGRILFSNCDDCNPRFLPAVMVAPSFWYRTIKPGKPLTLIGGRTFPIGGSNEINIELASLGDPNLLVNTVILNEMMEHMAWPMGLMLVFVIGATITSIRIALRPVATAVAAADVLDPRQSLRALPMDALPSEIASLVGSVNRAFQRVEDIIRSQKIFAASISHEIRTPVSIIKLEIAHIADPRARRAERDLDSLTHTLEQLTALARLDVSEGEAFQISEIADLVEKVVGQIAPLVFSDGKSISFERTAEPKAFISPPLIITLVRNLIENAIKHTPDGTNITVRVEIPAVIIVSDDGAGFRDATGNHQNEFAIVKKTGSLGIGLKIAERIAVLHGGVFSVQTSPTGTTARVDLSLAVDRAANLD